MKMPSTFYVKHARSPENEFIAPLTIAFNVVSDSNTFVFSAVLKKKRTVTVCEFVQHQQEFSMHNFVQRQRNGATASHED